MKQNPISCEKPQSASRLCYYFSRCASFWSLKNSRLTCPPVMTTMITTCWCFWCLLCFREHQRLFSLFRNLIAISILIFMKLKKKDGQEDDHILIRKLLTSFNRVQHSFPRRSSWCVIWLKTLETQSVMPKSAGEFLETIRKRVTVDTEAKSDQVNQV